MKSLAAGIAFGLGAVVALIGLRPDYIRGIARGLDAIADHVEESDREADIRLGEAIAQGLRAGEHG